MLDEVPSVPLVMPFTVARETHRHDIPMGIGPTRSARSDVRRLRRRGVPAYKARLSAHESEKLLVSNSLRLWDRLGHWQKRVAYQHAQSTHKRASVYFHRPAAPHLEESTRPTCAQSLEELPETLRPTQRPCRISLQPWLSQALLVRLSPKRNTTENNNPERVPASRTKGTSFLTHPPQ